MHMHTMSMSLCVAFCMSSFPEMLDVLVAAVHS